MDDTTPAVSRESAAWLFFVRAAFAVALTANAIGIACLPVDVWQRGYLAIGALFLVGATITMSKALRDEHEARRLLHRITEAKAAKILREYEPA